MTDIVHGAAPGASRVSDAYRWTQLAVGVGAMVMIANYQYGWTFFVPDIQKKFGWDRASIQWAFTLFVIFETWLVPFEGWFVDKIRATTRGACRRDLLWCWMGDNFLRNNSQRLLSGHDRCGHRCRCRLWHVRRKCSQVVS